MSQRGNIVGPCPNCQGGKLYGETLYGATGGCAYQVAAKMEPIDAYLIDRAQLACASCGAKFEVEAEPMPKIAIRLVRMP
jgi:hypothetical protein